MKYINLILLLLLFTLTSKSQCDYETSSSLPSTLALYSGDTLCVNGNHSISTSIVVYSGGVISIQDNFTFSLNGSLTIYSGGRVRLLNCNSKLEVYGSYQGPYNECELIVYCSPEEAVDPLIFVSGSKLWNNWCREEPLPVELASFEGEVVNESKNSITWVTLSEINNWYFELEKSKDGKLWESVEKVDGNNGFEIERYTLNDVEIETAYYRLKQVDFDGTTTYSKVIVIRKEGKREIIKKVNIIGQEVGDDYDGLVIIIYNDGSREIIK